MKLNDNVERYKRLSAVLPLQCAVDHVYKSGISIEFVNMKKEWILLLYNLQIDSISMTYNVCKNQGIIMATSLYGFHFMFC